MKTRIVIGCGMLLTLGTAVAGTWIYGQGRADASIVDAVAPMAAAMAIEQEATPEMIAMWKATAVSSDYIAPRVPF